MSIQDKSILLVDDEDYLRISVRKVLELNGAKVFDAADGKIAWDVLQRNTIDVVISDFKMPAIDGLELLNLMREANLRAPFIFVTGFSPKTREQLIAAGAHAVLNKPYDTKVLIRTIEEATAA